MKKGWIIAIITVIIIAALTFISYNWFTNNNNNQPNNDSGYQAARTLAERENNINQITTQNQTNQNEIKTKPVETELYSFSTPIKSDDKNRLTNIKITCSRINETIVKAGKEFSFCDTAKQPSSADGYKPADALGKNGEKIKAVGGGNCQVSTTIYNAALNVKGLKITERHEHSRDVAYIKDGKDATVAYDYLDLKFKNTNNFDIKLYASANSKKVTVKIFKIA